ncbi:hypothetical protein D6C86_08674 [Aureobasidium pullulans]|uniref:F-box domain-containing protein n=1 Tax=Aureobasidium pullulans TaxID=5580 RepID=A0A4S9VSQ1_AURPU|nr:hypothetical protein D6C94_09208 [Aureobasidium pullulans]THZ34031.1 hypothetical protein D6C87_10616 [Aureobasidium pullulans]THZ55353.1 hypothetical protein D6C86_08674 [Aureobasidium pullulans]THZ63062.1 hypothetical protein D6C88_08537 [Aureobasidium pullulans]
METQIEKLYKMRLNPAQPMADGSDHATRLPPVILIRGFCLIPDDALACIKTCKTSKNPAITVHWRKFNNQRFKNLLDMDDKDIDASYIAHARDIAIKFSEYWHDLPDWFPSSTTQPKNEYYNACTRRDGKGINISHLITPKLRSLELDGFNTRHFVLALCQVTGLETLRVRPLSDSYMEFLPIVSCSPALKTLELNDRVRSQDSIFIALAQHPCIEDIALTLTHDFDIVTCALANPKPFTSQSSLNIAIRFAAIDDLLSALPRLESLTMHVYDIDTQSMQSVTNKIRELGRLQNLTLKGKEIGRLLCRVFD